MEHLEEYKKLNINNQSIQEQSFTDFYNLIHSKECISILKKALDYLCIDSNPRYIYLAYIISNFKSDLLNKSNSEPEPFLELHLFNKSKKITELFDLLLLQEKSKYVNEIKSEIFLFKIAFGEWQVNPYDQDLIIPYSDSYSKLLIAAEDLAVQALATD
jgi:hypothetical protein